MTLLVLTNYVKSNLSKLLIIFVIQNWTQKREIFIKQKDFFQAAL